MAEQVPGVEDLAATDAYPVPEDGRFVVGGIEREFIDGPDLEVLAGNVIEQFSMRIAEDFDIRWLWKREQTGEAMGKCSRTTGALKHFTDADFVIWVAADGPREHQFTRRQIEAVVYHELLHVSITDKGKPAIRKHDAEVFREELREFGLWNTRLQKTFGQLEMPLYADRPF